MIRPTVSNVRVSLYRIATDFPESDGTFEWNETTIVVVRLAAGSCKGLGSAVVPRGLRRLCP